MFRKADTFPFSGEGRKASPLLDFSEIAERLRD
jgi:hypothetical protein